MSKAASLLPFITEALNDIFGRMDKIQNSLDQVNTNIMQSLNKFNELLDKVNDGINDLGKKFSDTGGLRGYRENIKILLNTVDNVNETFWYLDFLTALKRILSVVEKR